MNKSKISLIILVLVLAALAGGLLYYQNKHPKITNHPSGQNQSPVPPEKPKDAFLSKKTYSAGELPEGLPADLPLEKNALVLESYTATFATKENNVRLEDGNLATLPDFKQSTYSYTSAKTLAENNKIYKNYFNGKKYKLMAETLTDAIAVLSYSVPNKTSQTFQFSAALDEQTNKTTVIINKVFPIFGGGDLKGMLPPGTK
jgi:hypothetical protein